LIKYALFNARNQSISRKQILTNIE